MDDWQRLHLLHLDDLFGSSVGTCSVSRMAVASSGLLVEGHRKRLLEHTTCDCTTPAAVLVLK